MKLWLAAFFLLLSWSFLPHIVYAQSASELQAQIAEHNKQISALQAEIAKYQKELDTLGKAEKYAPRDG